MIHAVLSSPQDEKVIKKVRGEAMKLCRRFPYNG